MPYTAGDALRLTAQLLNHFGLDTTGTQYATLDGRLTVPAAAFRAITGKTPNAFLSDRDLSALLIESNETVMDTLRAISAVLDTHPPVTDGRDDHLEHVFHWSTTPGVGQTLPPSFAEVIGRILRAAQTADHGTQPLNIRPHAA